MVAPAVPAVAKLFITIGRVRIRTITLPTVEMNVFVKGVVAALQAVGLKITGPARNVKVYTETLGYVKKTIRITGTKTELKAAALAVGSVIAFGDELIGAAKKRIIPKKPTVHKRKYTLTKKQAAKLKKAGYVYVTRNKKQVKITR